MLGNLGSHYVEANQLDLAEEPLQRALAIHRETANLRFEGILQCNISALRVKQHRYEEALKCYDKALEINPKDACAWNNKGRALRKLNQYEVYIPLLKHRFLKVIPKNLK